MLFCVKFVKSFIVAQMNDFLGEYESTLDAKGRFLLPVGFKKQLPKEEGVYFVINRGFERCLTLYPIQNWEPIYHKISALNDFNPQVRTFRRYFLNGAIMAELDSAGRLLIPKNLVEHAGLTKDIVLSAAVNKIEIWDKQQYQQLFENFSAKDFSDLAKEVMSNLF